MRFSTFNEEESISEINIIPLVDVMLVLLIIFMVTAPLSMSGVNVNLPQIKAKGASVPEDRVVISIAKNGDVYLEKLVIPAAQLEEKMMAMFAKREKKELFIRADREVLYGRVIEVMGAAKQVGVQKISMLTQPPEKKGM